MPVQVWPKACNCLVLVALMLVVRQSTIRVRELLTLVVAIGRVVLLPQVGSCSKAMVRLFDRLLQLGRQPSPQATKLLLMEQIIVLPQCRQTKRPQPTQQE